ncbi:MAG: Lrp/AsnC family transcriptional regulator [Desulfobacterales bacterium]|nr:Lrp/AsnC family transcriptional regulator [Desulfobacterales bacterium]
MAEFALDDTDSQIIRLLETNGRMPNTEIAKQTGISEATVRKRLQRLLDNECIRILPVGDPNKLGFGIIGIIRVKSDIKKNEFVQSEMIKLYNLSFIARLSGQWDFNVEFYVKSIDAANELLKSINMIDGVIDTDSCFILKHIRSDLEWGKTLLESGLLSKPK